MNRNLQTILTFFIGIVFGVVFYGTYKAHTQTQVASEPQIITEYVYLEKEPEIVTEVIYIEREPDFFRNYSDSDAWYFMDYAMREGESEGVVGMLWLMYTLENRCEAFGTTPAEEWASHASESSMFRTGIEPNENCLKAYELFVEGWTPKPLYFRAGQYHAFGTHLCQVGNHYFSTK